MSKYEPHAWEQGRTAGLRRESMLDCPYMGGDKLKAWRDGLAKGLAESEFSAEARDAQGT